METTTAIGIGSILTIAVGVLKVIWDRIKDARDEGVKQASIAVSAVKDTADEAKRLAIEAKEDLNEHRMHVAINHPTNAAITKMELALEKIGNQLFGELKEISIKLDGKMDKNNHINHNGNGGK